MALYAFVTKYSAPNGTLPLGVVRGEAWALIGGLNFMAPGHYLKDFHKNFVDAAKLDEMVKKYNLQTWNQLFLEGPIAMFALNPDLPVVGAWRTKVAAGADRMVQERNPYYFQVDEQGKQLPYMDEITHDIFENQESFNLKLVAGEVDLQIRHVQLKDYSLLKENEAKGNYKVIVWKSDENFGYSINPTPRNEDTTVDEAQSAIVSKADFRRAMSLAINREEVNDLLFNGLATPRASSPVPGSPVYKQAYDEAYSAYDPEQANALLDGLGLTERDAEGFRKRPDGQTLTLRLDVDAAPGSIGDDMNQLTKGYWEEVGVKTVVNTMERSLRETIQFSDRFSVIGGGISNTAVPLSFDGWHNTIGGGWGRYLRNPADPLAIEPPADNEDVATAKQVWEIIQDAYGMLDFNAAHTRLMEALDIFYEQVYNIGVVGATPAPGVVSNRMRNVPDNLIWGNALMRINMAQPPQIWIEE
jgi:peptide/nickel transport system substrate-binding protein